MTKYCANECENEATEYFLNDAGEKTYLCHPCGVAFRWGQVHPDNKMFFLEENDISDNELEDFANTFERLPDELRKILGSGESLREYVLKPVDRYKGWEIRENTLVYFDTGFEHFFMIPDWDKIRRDIISNYEIDSLDALDVAFGDALYSYSLYSRG